jgi:hypothetical protein
MRDLKFDDFLRLWGLVGTWKSFCAASYSFGSELGPMLVMKSTCTAVLTSFVAITCVFAAFTSSRSPSYSAGSELALTERV